MLLAVEGGGFFSSSASGYSKGLALLLLGHKNEDKPMRVSPWNHYQLVDQESNPNLQLASTKNWSPRGCASFVCFGRTSAGLDTPSPLKVGPAQQQDVLPESPTSDERKDGTDPGYDNDTRKVDLRSSLKKPSDKPPISFENANERDDIRGYMERRKVQWTDARGSELVQIREFEPSEVDGSDDEFDNENERNCSCTIM
ncbi:hypothetical protein I3760_16G008400 [Carya illinoinensis]|uniref:Uncharacterized protein n=1 Tax=Carya illinoinensis TaxID=32201 RepID=A0A8T1N1E0_CARIL|nr:uncharacterized protein LOC122299537 [Carya illinoinensis]XP_042965832.1 uncharacterized protein LOC122299537 [Carya illinoinensis]XP_042965833.1 uncharacterized protein LOC122299537 [Carya illinoinensis]XP_042965834.1 uncharacterized protein LOC122299537 [Carya illinoinensis]XP_042965835.1 uncharacterized protein LOC122299537 [Carya illinoinensis]KAG2663042.1 hypothetical protein I3760_16G008400 [Carya illinoinensis]KAG2663043.1 hypothetical protein I3760_16G008400 [Carya illinoinensis]K